ncbi:hypothetical protein PR048_018048 [Dryococelus australis]|uniref:Uncharacterized protein n=1 Tax=Dryococelus australis TaxID=614101 RepID=A0ABQ9HB75_9NEOP|nr:hypothetical protein PR048_018048 [Dryococelus australis]
MRGSEYGPCAELVTACLERFPIGRVTGWRVLRRLANGVPSGVERSWAALNIEVLRADEVEAKKVCSSTGIQGRGKREKTHRPALSSGTIPTCENPGANPPATTDHYNTTAPRLCDMLLMCAAGVGGTRGCLTSVLFRTLCLLTASGIRGSPAAEDPRFDARSTQVARRQRPRTSDWSPRQEAGTGKVSVVDYSKKPSQRLPGVISGNHGKPESGWPDKESKPTFYQMRHLAQLYWEGRVSPDLPVYWLLVDASISHSRITGAGTLKNKISHKEDSQNTAQLFLYSSAMAPRDFSLAPKMKSVFKRTHLKRRNEKRQNCERV